MKILHLSSEFPPQHVFGLGRYVHELASAQSAAGHDVEVFTNSLSGREFETKSNGATVYRAHFPPPPKAPQSSSMILHFNLQLVERCMEAVKPDSKPCDVINAHDWLAFPAAFHLGRLLKRPVITTFHELLFSKMNGPNPDAEQAFIAGIQNWAVHTSAKIIVLSESVRKVILQAYHAAPDRVVVVPGGVGIQPLAESEYDQILSWRRRVAGDNEDLILCAGRLDRKKGVLHFIKALQQFRQHRRFGWRAVIAGSGSLQKELESGLNASGLRDVVTLTGYLEASELRIAFAAADVTAVPSDYETFGLVSLESQRIGTPVIVAETSGLAETIRLTQGGLTFAPGNVSELALRLDELLKNSEKRVYLGKRGQELVSQYYSWEVIEKGIAEVYRGVLGGPAPQNITAPEWTWNEEFAAAMI